MKLKISNRDYYQNFLTYSLQTRSSHKISNMKTMNPQCGACPFGTQNVAMQVTFFCKEKSRYVLETESVSLHSTNNIIRPIV